MMRPMTQNRIPSFMEALTFHMDRSGDDVTSLANRAGVSRDALYKVLYGKTKTPKLELIIGVASAFGETVEEFMGLSPAQVRDELLEEISLLSPSERAVLRATLAALRADSLGDAEDKASDVKPDPQKADQ